MTEPLARLLERVLATIADADIAGGSASFHIRFDFHICPSFPYFTVVPMMTSPLLLPALTFVLIFMVVFPFFEKLPL